MASLFSLKVSLASVTVLSVAIALNFYYPLISEYLVSKVPTLWFSLQSWLTPPYLYVVLNFIILTIAASSRFQHKAEEQIPDEPVKVQPDFAVVSEYAPVVVLNSPVGVQTEVASEPVVENLEAEVLYHEEETKVVVVEKAVDESEFVEPSLNEMPIRTESMEIPMEYSLSNEKPPVSARFAHRKTAKPNSEAGKSLRVTKPRRQDTLENTWKMITEGRSIPLARHLKKSDTWETHEHAHSELPEQVKKSETFNNRSSVSSALTRSQGSGKLKKEPSLSQDDLNRRVEAFINKFNEEMRLQRMESLNRYKETMNHGAQFQS